MIIWGSLIIYIVLLRFLIHDLRSKKKQKFFLIMVGAGIFFVMAFRYPYYENVYDLDGYVYYYKAMNYTDWNNIFNIPGFARFEYGYAILNKLLNTIIPWPQFILIFEAGLCVYAVCKFIYKNSNDPFLGILFYITLGGMSFQLTAFRQAIAISICLLSIELIKEKKLIKFILCIILAASMHQTAYCFLILYFLVNLYSLKNNRFIWILLICLSPFFATILSNFGNDVFDMQYSGYIGNEFGGFINIILYSSVIITHFLFNNEKKFSISLNMVLVGLCIYSMRYVTLALERISFYFTIGLVIALPEAISYARKNKKILIIMKLCVTVIAIALFMYRAKSSDWVNYRFFWT